MFPFFQNPKIINLHQSPFFFFWRLLYSVCVT